MIEETPIAAQQSLFWHDYETWGANPRWDRPAQFAGLRTDLELNPIDQPLILHCEPATDQLPHPDACLITGLTPQRVRAAGALSERAFFGEIERQLGAPGTCGVGYNSLRFDDEFTRYGFWRNFIDPYAREWKNGNSRWDIIDMLRLCHALRPEGMVWPRHDSGVTSFRLEDLTAANGIEHTEAHNALADVHATLSIARLVRERQPRLYNYLWQLRDKRKVGELLDLRQAAAVLHVSSMYPAERGCITLVAPLLRHPTNGNGVVVWDLTQDPSQLLQLTPEQIHQRLFTASADLPDGVQRVALKTVHLNKCPVLAPLSTLTPEAAERWKIDARLCEQHRQALLGSPDLAQRIAKALSRKPETDNSDAEGSLYAGFIPDSDRRRMELVRGTPASQLAALRLAFDDRRLDELLWRYCARNHEGELPPPLRQRWDDYRHQRVTDQDAAYGINLSQFRARLASLMVDPGLDPSQRSLLSELAGWPDEIGLGSGF